MHVQVQLQAELRCAILGLYVTCRVRAVLQRLNSMDEVRQQHESALPFLAFWGMPGMCAFVTL